MNESLDFMAGWLRGFFDGEGSARFCVHINKSGPKKGHRHTCYYLSVSNTDPVLMDICCKYLDALDIEHGCWKYRPTKPNRKPFATLHISKAKQIIKFANKVGFGAPHKAATLQAIIEWITRPYRDPIDVKRAAELHAQGIPITDVCAIIGLSRGSGTRVAKILRRHGYPVRTRTENTGRPKKEKAC